LLFWFGLLFLVGLLFALLFLLRVAKSSGSEKHKQQKCSADNSKSFHKRASHFSLSVATLIDCLVLISSGRRPVVYHPQRDANGKIPSSTLAALSAFFLLDQTATPTIATAITTPPATISTGEPRRARNADPRRSEWGRQD
jgi:hypothetical protein